ncbi:unnamed protein product [Malus baccata var. baccata]
MSLGTRLASASLMHSLIMQMMLRSQGQPVYFTTSWGMIGRWLISSMRFGTDLVPNTDIYCDVKADIEKHYRSKWKTWIPWTFLAFIGVLVELLLCGI